MNDALTASRMSLRSMYANKIDKRASTEHDFMWSMWFWMRENVV